MLRHPLGGFMVPLSKDAPEIPDKDKAEEMIKESLHEMDKNLMGNKG